MQRRGVPRVKRRRYKGLGGAYVQWGRDAGPMVEVTVCTTPDPKKPPVCYEGGYGLIDTGSHQTLLAAGKLPPEMFPPGFAKSGGGRACFVGMEKGVETCTAPATFHFPGCTDKGVPVPVEIVPRELPRPGIVALIGVDVLKAVGATVHPNGSPRTVLSCRASRKPRAAVRGARACGPEDPRICGMVTLCPPDATDNHDPGCRELSAAFDTGAPTTLLSPHFVDSMVTAVRYPPLALTQVGSSWEGEAGGAHIVTEARLTVPGCETQRINPTVSDTPLPIDADVIVGMDYLRQRDVSLYPWATPPFATCKKPRRVKPTAPPEASLIEW